MKSSRKTEIMQNFFDYIARSEDFDHEDFKAQFDLTDTEIDVCTGVCNEDETEMDDLVVYVKCGIVQKVRCSNPNMEAYICDYDTIDENENAVLEAERIGSRPYMHAIY